MALKIIQRCNNALTPLNTSNNVLIPQGQVAIATVLGATLADGLTPVSIPALSNALTTYYATASTTFTPEHIGQLVTCIEIHTHNQLVITGVVMPTQPAELEAHSLLDEAIEHTQSPQAKSAQQEPVDSALAQSLDNHMGDDIEPFDEFDCVSGADNVDETSAEEYAFFNQQGAQAHAVIRGEQSIVLQCGASSLMLLADGVQLIY